MAAGPSLVVFSLLSIAVVKAIPFEEFEPAWKAHLVKRGLGRVNMSRASDYPATVEFERQLPIPNVQFLPGPTGPQTLTLIPGGIIDSDVKCGGDNRNFCNYPSLPFIETLNVPNVLASPNRLNRLPSGPCPENYSKLPTMDCLNIAAAFIETTCCVYNSPPVTLTDYCNARAGILFTASFELCDGRNFIISGSNAWQVDENFRVLGGPYSLSTLTGGTVSSGVDSALVDSSCNVGFFVGTTLKWMNFPGKTASADQSLSALLGTIPTAICGGLACTPTMVNFAVCPNNGYCMIGVSLLATSGTVFKQIFFLAPGFNSFVSTVVTPPGIAVTNQARTNALSSTAATTIFFYDAVGRLVSGPTNLFDLFGVCGGVGAGAAGSGYTIFVPIPMYGPQPNGTNGALYSAPAASASYGPPQQQSIDYGPPPQPSAPSGYDTKYAPPPQQYQAPAPPPPQNLYRDQPAPPNYQPSYQVATPAPQPYQKPQVQPQYQPTPPPYQAPAPVYQAPQPQYATPVPQPYQQPTPKYQYQPPQPTPAPQPYMPPSVYLAPYNQPYLPSPAPSAVVIRESVQPQPQPSPLKQEDAPAPSTLPPQGPPIRKRAPAPSTADSANDLLDNTVFKPPFKAPESDFFDVSAFIRKGDIERFQPARELKLV
ncbi:hypothetical protein BV898_16540 [Hypsibius exemplaris]|uniref:Uncharacterized protein n=1 Tax=Hypsibius exemplaris TaxID=2072580 RepID=A0A9X6NDF8_HYPEX|nr:hypothetical protein BV898_16540 [Hypsibius exemplaris]